ncbi:MAG: hypothetical protein RIC55_24360 [Pirellulaceae bacterium]
MMPELLDILRLCVELTGIALFGMGIGVQPCCCGGSLCVFCLDGTTPNELEVTIAGLVDRDCGNCAALNDTYILEYLGEVPAGCCWQFAFDETCNFDVIVACLSEPIALGYQLEVSFGRQGPTSDVITFLKSLGSEKPNCGWNELDVPVTAQIQTQCDDDSATCTVSAV